MNNFKRLFEELCEGKEKGDGPEYKAFFQKTLKKYGVKSQAELKGADVKKFHDEIDAGWEADEETD